MPKYACGHAFVTLWSLTWEPTIKFASILAQKNRSSRCPAFIIAIFPGWPWLNVERLHVDPAQPVSDRLSCKLGTIVRPDVLRGSSLREKLRQHGQNVVVPEPSLDMDRQALPPVLVNDCQHAEGSAVVGPICDEVVRPHMLLYAAVSTAHRNHHWTINVPV